jgi:hypothetical protein
MVKLERYGLTSILLPQNRVLTSSLMFMTLHRAININEAAIPFLSTNDGVDDLSIYLRPYTLHHVKYTETRALLFIIGYRFKI